MRSSIISALALLTISAFASPLVIPSGTPPNHKDPLPLSKLAGGGPPDAPLPANISDTAVTVFTVVNFLENFEGGFFTQGINWIKQWNYEGELDALLDIITSINAQEAVHVATAEAVLKHYGKPTVEPCKYTFPGVKDVHDFIALANTITVTGIGAVIEVTNTFSRTDPELVSVFSSILGNEARQGGFFRLAEVTTMQSPTSGDLNVNVLQPQPAAFDTRISAAYAFNLASPFISDCPAPPPALPIFPSLKADLPETQQKVTGSSGPIKFRFDNNQLKPIPTGTLYIGWVNQANDVKYTPATIDQNGVVGSEIPDGLAGGAFAALTDQNSALEVDALTEKTLAGPAVVMIS